MTSNDTDTISVCPHCNQPDIETRTPHKPTSDTNTHKHYRCNNCQEFFNNPITRAARDHTGAGSGSRLAAKLVAMDPGEVPADD